MSSLSRLISSNNKLPPHQKQDLKTIDELYRIKKKNKPQDQIQIQSTIIKEPPLKDNSFPTTKVENFPSKVQNEISTHNHINMIVKSTIRKEGLIKNFGLKKRAENFVDLFEDDLTNNFRDFENSLNFFKSQPFINEKKKEIKQEVQEKQSLSNTFLWKFPYNNEKKFLSNSFNEKIKKKHSCLIDLDLRKKLDLNNDNEKWENSYLMRIRTKQESLVSHSKIPKYFKVE